MLTIIQQLILGVIQGIFEWLPISSSAVLTLVMTNFFHITDLSNLLHLELFLHLGTFFAALIYFRKDVFKIFKTVTGSSKKFYENEYRKIFKFLLIATLISGVLGYAIFRILEIYQTQFGITGKIITLFVGILLFFTGVIQIKVKNKGLKNADHLKTSDSVLLGGVQGISVLPGVSRSGITVSALLLRNFNDTTALRLSFLLSLPIVLIANLFLNYHDLIAIAQGTGSTLIYGLLASFILGLLTIHGLIKLSQKINFGWFVLIFSILILGSLII